MLFHTGEIDKLSLEEAGFKNVISVPHGAPPAVREGPLPESACDKGFAYMWNCWVATEQASTILLGSNWDPSGHALAEESAGRLGISLQALPAQCFVLFLSNPQMSTFIMSLTCGSF